MLANSKVAIHQHTHFPRDHIHFLAYELLEQWFSMVGANGFGRGILSGCGVFHTKVRIDFLVFYGCSTCLISSSLAPMHWTYSDQIIFPGEPLTKVIVCEVKIAS